MVPQQHQQSFLFPLMFHLLTLLLFPVLLGTIPSCLSLLSIFTYYLYRTAYQAVHRKLRLKAGQTVLVTGGSGSVGGFAVQFAHLSGPSPFLLSFPLSFSFISLFLHLHSIL